MKKVLLILLACVIINSASTVINNVMLNFRISTEQNLINRVALIITILVKPIPKENELYSGMDKP